MTPFNEKEKKEKRYQNDQWVDLSPDFKPMSLCTQAWVVVSRWAGGGAGAGVKEWTIYDLLERSLLSDTTAEYSS